MNDATTTAAVAATAAVASSVAADGRTTATLIVFLGERSTVWNFLLSILPRSLPIKDEMVEWPCQRMYFVAPLSIELRIFWMALLLWIDFFLVSYGPSRFFSIAAVVVLTSFCLIYFNILRSSFSYSLNQIDVYSIQNNYDFESSNIEWCHWTSVYTEHHQNDPSFILYAFAFFAVLSDNKQWGRTNGWAGSVQMNERTIYYLDSKFTLCCKHICRARARTHFLNVKINTANNTSVPVHFDRLVHLSLSPSFTRFRGLLFILASTPVNVLFNDV